MEIDLDERYHEQLRDRAERKGFDSPEAYATEIVESILDEPGSENDEADRDRLEVLGYL